MTDKRVLTLVCVMLIVPAIVMSQTTTEGISSAPLDALIAYHEADKAEDINAMMELTDFSDVNPAELNAFKQQMKYMLEKLAETFDTVSYAITNATVMESGDNAIVFYTRSATVKDATGKTVSSELEFVAQMRKDNGKWKIVYMQPKVVFERRVQVRQMLDDIGENLGDVTVSQLEEELKSIDIEVEVPRVQDYKIKFKELANNSLVSSKLSDMFRKQGWLP